MSSNTTTSSGKDIFQSMKKVSQRFASAVADTGAKTLLKTDMVFLERDIKSRKQAFGLEVYDILSSSSSSTTTTTTSAYDVHSEQVQLAYEKCKADIDMLENKLQVKKMEREAIDTILAGGGGVSSSSGGTTTTTTTTVEGGGNNNIMMEDKETPGIPATP